MIKEYAEGKLKKEGFTKDQLEKVFKHIPMPSHNQRGTGVLMIGSDQRIKAEKLVKIVENSMSSRVLDLLKRVDELEIVRNAHLNPRFVEDVVREMVALTIKEFDFLSDDDYFLAKQTNYEGIHSYEVYAERSGTIGEIKEEIEKAENNYIDEDYVVNCNNTSSEEWLKLDGGC
jgi:MptA/FolE2 family GTP cyclohydrolase